MSEFLSFTRKTVSDKNLRLLIGERKFVEYIQVLKAVESWSNDRDTAIQVFPSVIITCTSMTKYLNLIFNAEKVKDLLFRVKKNYESMMDIPQKVLMESGSMYGRTLTLFYATWILIAAAFYFIIPALPIILDIVIPLNESREKKFLFEAEYLVDKQKYYYYIFLNELLSGLLVVYIAIALDTMYLVFVQHGCTLFVIAGNQVKYLHILENYYIDNEEAVRLTEKYKWKSYDQVEYDEMYKNLRFGIQIHKDAISFCNVLQSSFSTSLAIQIMLNVLGVSIGLIQMIINLDNDDLLRFVSLTIGLQVHLFFLCYSGERIINYSIQLYYDACSAKWYLFSRRVQVLYKLLVLRSLFPCKIKAGNVIVVGMETFQTMSQTAVSYFTVFSSVR